jgi:hypothetical protein
MNSTVTIMKNAMGARLIEIRILTFSYKTTEDGDREARFGCLLGKKLQIGCYAFRPQESRASVVIFGCTAAGQHRCRGNHNKSQYSLTLSWLFAQGRITCQSTPAGETFGVTKVSEAGSVNATIKALFCRTHPSLPSKRGHNKASELKIGSRHHSKCFRNYNKIKMACDDYHRRLKSTMLFH